ncbi:hypothetical protein MASR2M29_07280 [Spirochaetota bacterium]
MNHKKGFNKLNRKSSHRKAMLKNMATVLFKHERITTTKAKALEVRRNAEKMITRAKEDSVHNRRIIAEKITDEAVLNKLFTDIGPRMKERNGGYTRILKIGFRDHDAASMVLLELVDYKPDAADKKKKPEPKPKKAEAKKSADSKKENKKKDTKSKAPRATKKAADTKPAKKEAAESEKAAVSVTSSDTASKE